MSTSGHRTTERIVAVTPDIADGLGKSGLDVGTPVSQSNESRVGVAVGNLAAWCVEDIAGGIYEGIGEA